MKAKLILLTVIALFIIIGGAGCEKKPRYEIYENHEITACGIKDPLNNLQWLKDYCDSHSKWYSVNIFLYNNTSDVNHIMIETNTKFNQNESPSSINVKYIYSCKGERLLFYGTEGPKPAGWDEFFVENKEIAKIWSVKEAIN